MARLVVDEATSVPGDIVNDDVVGYRASAAWVIDGATDLCDEPLVDRVSDAAWLANLIDDWLTQRPLPARLVDIIGGLTQFASDEFARLSKRAPIARFEHPSAAGLIVRLDDGKLEYLALGDCSLIVQEPRGDVIRYGVSDVDAGDARLTDRLTEICLELEKKTVASIEREGLMPVLRDGRGRMNQVPGYGIFSITPPPPEYVMTERLEVTTDTRLLLASDGFMRLVDVFRMYPLRALIDRTFELGIAATIEELRRMEQADAAGYRFPRAKCHDDATALLARVVA